MDRDQAVESVVKALRRANFQGSIFGQSVAIRLGLSESDIDALELLIDTGAATAGRLAEVLGMTSGAVTRVIDRLEQAGYVRRTTDPADRRRVVVEIVPERAASLDTLLGSLERAAQDEAGRYTPEQLATINDFHGRMADLTQTEAARLRTTAQDDPTVAGGPAEHTAPLGGLTAARLMFRAGAQDVRLRPGRSGPDLFRAKFDGATPQVRVRDGRVLVQYRGIPFDWRKRTANIGLNPGIPWTVELVGGIQRLEADLRGIDLQRFELTGGTERIQLELGRPTREVPIKIVGGASSIRFERPADVPVRLHLQGGTNGVQFDGRPAGAKGGDVVMDSTDADRGGAKGRYLIEVVGGSKSIEVVRRPA
jgi:DNA-binding MarR family transcriptional regulator